MTNRLLVSKSSLLQYFALYVLVMMNSSRLWSIIQHRDETISYIIKISIIIIWVLISISSDGKLRDRRNIFFVLFLTITVIFVRFVNGGAGLDVLSEWASYIFIVDICIKLNKEQFLNRFINTVYVLAGISIICFTVQIIAPDILKSLFSQYDSNFQSYAGWGVNGATYITQQAWGKYLFTFDERNVTRNMGVFSEPGCYQIVLNSAIFVLLFLREYIDFEPKQYNKRLFVMCIALVTSQSTTGYIGLCLLLLFYATNKDTDAIQTKRIVLCIVITALVVLLGDYVLNRNNSIIGSVIISKVFGSGKSIDLTKSTGIYRVQTIIAAMDIMLKHPFGVGFSEANAMVTTLFSESAGAVLILTGAALGVIPFLGFIIWTLKPVACSTALCNKVKVLYILLWINTTLAQSEELYTGLILVPMYCAAVLYPQLKRYNGGRGSE